MNKTKTKGRKIKAKGKNVATKTTKRTITAKTAGFFLKVPPKLKTTLGVMAEADKKFKGSNWQAYGLHKLREIADV